MTNTLTANRFPADPAPATAHAQPNRLLDAAILIGTGLLSFAPIAILGPSIGWPASLRAPAADQLAAIFREQGAVAAGYGVYLLFSVLVLPVMLVVARRVFGNLAHPMAQLVIAFAALSVLARSIGILRWLTVMPQLATAHASADPQGQAVIQTVFRAVTVWGGGIGELLGVALFMAASLSIAMMGALRLRSTPAWLAGLGLVSAALLFGMFLPTVGIAFPVPIAVSASLVSVWMLAFGVWVAVSKRTA
ncbi:MAG TPA: DUF4386 family protein [Polaromonas sp.]|uniref:DUF4386 family protein n=1 Tax=Polaromonas sp. TaxID=1869339 RepID=UPI002D31BBEA|nr:DUF4386 family protein [Polaromonas sp.]HYW58412.1 DUF4386 family protein [Polaromonas sp.]